MKSNRSLLQGCFSHQGGNTNREAEDPRHDICPWFVLAYGALVGQVVQGSSPQRISFIWIPSSNWEVLGVSLSTGPKFTASTKSVQTHPSSIGHPEYCCVKKKYHLEI